MAHTQTPTPLKGEAEDSAQAPSLCTQCGLCCTSAIYKSAVLDEDEVDAARNVGLPVLDRPGRPTFALACPKLSGTLCTIFGHRPRVCGRFRCRLLIDFESGETGHSDALAIIRRARRLFSEAALGGVNNELPELALQLYLDRHFRKTADAKSFGIIIHEDVMEADVESGFFVRSQEALFAEVGDDVLALHVANGRCHGMESVAADIWKMLDRPVSISQICDRLVGDYDVSRDECRRDIANFVKSMMSEGLVKAQ